MAFFYLHHHIHHHYDDDHHHHRHPPSIDIIHIYHHAKFHAPSSKTGGVIVIFIKCAIIVSERNGGHFAVLFV